MHTKAFDYATVEATNATGISGGDAVEERDLRVGERTRGFGRLFRYGFLAGTLSLLPLQQAMADDNRAFLPAGFLDVSTIASNGDLNPYGVAFVPDGFPSNGKLSPGDILVSNFNNSGNIQGTGTTITRVTPDGVTSTFFIETFIAGNQGGLTTALGVLKRGFVVVGQVPNSDGTATGAPTAGSLLFLDKNAKVVPPPYANANLDGPWDLAIDDDFDHAKIFVSSVLNGTVVRLDVSVGSSSVTVNSITVIANGYSFSPPPATPVFALGPTGLAYDDERDVLYVASTQDNKIFKIPQAGARTTPVSQGILVYEDSTHLRGPLGLALEPNGNLLTANGDAVNSPPATPPPLPSQIVEFTKEGKFIGQLSVDPVAGAAFGIAVARQTDDSARFAAVNDDDNTIDVLNLNVER
jgi:hypothetical protein